ncbi:MAG: hypothetical protein KF708_02010 [Pirellulales bacterium]|nr:hypothetical protein [Pirellulales bacterium]
MNAVADRSLDKSRSRGLSIGNFRRIAAHGFGDGHNSYAYSYAWHQGYLYIGTHRDLLVLARTRFKFDIPTQVWPVEVPAAFDPREQGGEIWRYDAQADHWDRVYKSPVTAGIDGRTVPVAAGFRSMAVFQGRSDSHPCLYTIPSCGSFGIGPVLLRSSDGSNFEQIGQPGLGLGDGNITAYRSMIALRDRLFMAPAGSRGADPNLAYQAVIFCSDDPATGAWQPANVNAFGDPSNYGVYDMCVAGDYLYAGTMNIREGCQLWKTKAEGEPPFRWTKVLDRGADRASYYNQGVVCLTEFQGCVYFGTGVQNGGYDKVNNIGPAAGEVIRVYPDDTWDVVAGDPRMTRYGLKVPRSGLGAGFDNPFAGYIWRMCQHDGCLYVGTMDSSSMLPFGDPKAPERRAFDERTVEQYMRWRGGCELWCTADGDRWIPVTRNGFGNPYNWGIRSLLSTPRGLFVGTANPYGPNVAMRSPEGWRYLLNPQGGVEVWHGSHDHKGDLTADDFAAGETLPPLTGIESGSRTLGERVLALPDLGDSAPGAPEPPEMLDRVWHETTLDNPSARPRHHEPEFRHDHTLSLAADPYTRLSIEERDSIVLPTDTATTIAGFYHGTALRNTGYWRREELSGGEAAKGLVEELTALALTSRADLATTSPRVLAIARGAADAPAIITRLLPQAFVTTCEPDEPLPSDQFDVILAVEAFSSLERAAAYQTLAERLVAGGVIVAADPIGPTLDEGVARQSVEYVSDKIVSDLAAMLAQAGLVDIHITDVTHETWYRFNKSSRIYFGSKLLLYHLEKEDYEAILRALPGGDLIVDAYVVVRGQMPGADSAPSESVPS